MSTFSGSNLLAHELDAVIVTDEAFCIVGWNRAATELYGWASGEVLGKATSEVIVTEYLGVDYDEVVARFLADGRWQGEVIQYNRDGARLQVQASVSMLTDRAGKMIGAVAVNREIHERQWGRPTLTEVGELQRLAYHDALTGLPNRRLLEEHMRKLAAGRREGDRVLHLACLDLDGFKAINDDHGHHVGDRVLEQVAQRLQGSLREQDLVARIGGDEFVIVFEGGDSCEIAGALERLEGALTTPYQIDGESIRVGVSIGVAAGADSALPELLGEADRVMYGIKSRGGGIAFSNGQGGDAGWERLQIGADLQWALERGGLHCHYQPVIDLDGEHTIAHEVLLRWRHESRGPVPPDLFLAAAERSSLIEQLDRWVVRKSFPEARRRGLNLVVNVSPRTLARSEFVHFVAAELRANRLGPGRVQIDVAERAFAAPDAITPQLEALRTLGVSIALDDFGLGPTQLLGLGSLPVDVLKLDRRVVQQLGTRPEAGAVCGLMTRLARDLGLLAVAEGVEKRSQLELFRAAGGDQAQGSLFRLPGPLPPWRGASGGPVALSGSRSPR